MAWTVPSHDGLLVSRNGTRSLEVRFTTVVTFLLDATTLAFAPLLFLSHDTNAKAVFQQKARAYAAWHAETRNTAPELAYTESRNY